jgi:hypothetical protein
MINDLLEPTAGINCSVCGSASGVRRWRDLTEEQQEVVRKLQGTACYSMAERVARHAWCVVCWDESTGSASQMA